MPERWFRFPNVESALTRQIAVLVCFAATAVAQPVMAEPSRDTAGAGNSLCSAFLQEYGQDPAATAWVYLSWAQGYLSAVNLQQIRLGETAVDMLPLDFGLSKQIAFLHAYCRSRPERKFDQAAIEMYYELRARHTPSREAQSLP